MLVLVRHGRTQANAEHRFVGRLDPELDDVGRAQAASVASLLGPVAELRTSPLLRAMQTARLLGTSREPLVDDRFVELDFGDLEGTRVADVDPAIWALHGSDAAGALPGGESIRMVADRVAGALEELFAAPGEGARSDDGDVVVVTHMTPVKVAVAWALGVDPIASVRMRLANASVTRIGWGPRGPVLASYNEQAPGTA
jgi:probable phosphoglycerate mutase